MVTLGSDRGIFRGLYAAIHWNSELGVVVCLELPLGSVDSDLVFGNGFAVEPLLRGGATQPVDRVVVVHTTDEPANHSWPMGRIISDVWATAGSLPGVAVSGGFVGPAHDVGPHGGNDRAAARGNRDEDDQQCSGHHDHEASLRRDDNDGHTGRFSRATAFRYVSHNDSWAARAYWKPCGSGMVCHVDGPKFQERECGDAQDDSVRANHSVVCNQRCVYAAHLLAIHPDL